jgi:hypothetical protein
VKVQWCGPRPPGPPPSGEHSAPPRAQASPTRRAARRFPPITLLAIAPRRSVNRLGSHAPGAWRWCGRSSFSAPAATNHTRRPFPEGLARTRVRLGSESPIKTQKPAPRTKSSRLDCHCQSAGERAGVRRWTAGGSGAFCGESGLCTPRARSLPSRTRTV